jgi:hypothetical protein
MNRLSLLLLLWCPFASTTAQLIGGVDSTRVVILSDRVGPVIDLQEREQYRLFLQINGFVHAVVLQLPDTTFVIRFTIAEPGGRERDSLVVYGGPLLRNLAERIEHFEEILAGTYRISERPAVLKLATGGAVVYPTISIVAAPTALSGRPPQGQLPSGPLPLSPSHLLYRERAYPFLLDFGVGIRTFSPDLDGLSQVFQGTPSFSYSPLVTAHVELAVVEMFSVQAEAGTSTSSDGFTASVGFVFYVPIPTLRSLRPFIGAALEWCTVSGSYSGFDMAAGARGYSVTAGLEFLTKGVVGMDLLCGYAFFSPVSTTISDYTLAHPATATIDFSGPTFGLRLKFLQ